MFHWTKQWCNLQLMRWVLLLISLAYCKFSTVLPASIEPAHGERSKTFFDLIMNFQHWVYYFSAIPKLQKMVMKLPLAMIKHSSLFLKTGPLFLISLHSAPWSTKHLLIYMLILWSIQVSFHEMINKIPLQQKI